jgi:ribonuclease D
MNVPQIPRIWTCMALLTIVAILGAAISVRKYNASMSGMISDQDAFAQLCRELGQHDEFGLDTEFMRERTYFAQLCLLQLSFGAQAVCIDTLALADLSPLRASMEAPGIGKVLHAARQDLEVLAPVAGPLVGLFDTQVAAALIGLPAQIGYGDLVRQLLGHSLHKAETRTDWSRRPLSSAQLAYARDDVRYLLPLRALLTARLGELGRWHWRWRSSTPSAPLPSIRKSPGADSRVSLSWTRRASRWRARWRRGANAVRSVRTGRATGSCRTPRCATWSSAYRAAWRNWR